MNDEQKRQSVPGAYLDALDKSKGSNRDTEGLGVMTDGRFMIGSVDAINGRGGQEMPEFVATRHELEQVAGAYTPTADSKGCSTSSDRRRWIR